MKRKVTITKTANVGQTETPGLAELTKMLAKSGRKNPICEALNKPPEGIDGMIPQNVGD